MATCRVCGAEIVWADYDGGRIALDRSPSMRGPDRFILDDDGRTAIPVPQDRDALAARAHVTTCPRGDRKAMVVR